MAGQRGVGIQQRKRIGEAQHLLAAQPSPHSFQIQRHRNGHLRLESVQRNYPFLFIQYLSSWFI